MMKRDKRIISIKGEIRKRSQELKKGNKEVSKRNKNEIYEPRVRREKLVNSESKRNREIKKKNSVIKRKGEGIRK